MAMTDHVRHRHEGTDVEHLDRPIGRRPDARIFTQNFAGEITRQVISNGEPHPDRYAVAGCPRHAKILACIRKSRCGIERDEVGIGWNLANAPQELSEPLVDDGVVFEDNAVRMLASRQGTVDGKVRGRAPDLGLRQGRDGLTCVFFGVVD